MHLLNMPPKGTSQGNTCTKTTRQLFMSSAAKLECGHGERLEEHESINSWRLYGLLRQVVVTAADVEDRDGLKQVLTSPHGVPQTRPSLQSQRDCTKT